MRIVPGARIVRSKVRSREVADFERVITNASDVSPARDALSSALEGRIRIVSWSYPDDDDEDLRRALTALHAA